MLQSIQCLAQNLDKHYSFLVRAHSVINVRASEFFLSLFLHVVEQHVYISIHLGLLQMFFLPRATYYGCAITAQLPQMFSLATL